MSKTGLPSGAKGSAQDGTASVSAPAASTAASTAARVNPAPQADGFDWERLAASCGVRPAQARTVMELVDGGATVPFMARYRKEATGGLDEVWLRLIIAAHERQTALEKRRQAVLANLEERGVLSPELKASLVAAGTLAGLEDLYAPYKQKKKTRAEVARSRGLGPLADKAWKAPERDLEAACQALVGTCPELDSLEAVRDGVVDILAEDISHKPEVRSGLGRLTRERGGLGAKPKLKGEDWEKSPYRQYGDFSDSLKRLKPHQWLALRRGEKEGHLGLAWDLDKAGAEEWLAGQVRGNSSLLTRGRSEALERHLLPAVQREHERSLDEAAEKAAIDTFEQNLRPILLSAPLRGKRILAIDPGLRTGCKAVALEETGQMLGWFTFHTHKPDEAREAVARGIRKYQSQLVVIGNGTGTEAVQDAVAEVLARLGEADLHYTIVPEDGASVYSASDAAREEFPDLDVSVRGAVSLGRRVIDPLSELVKIDPKSLGVGMYQHDVDQKRLDEALQGVVEGVVNQVGVIGPSASPHVLRYVSGLGPALARKIADWRRDGGVFRCRRDLLKVPGLGPKTYEQCAGFIKFPDSPEPLDNTWVHPESYPLARRLMPLAKAGDKLAAADRAALKAEFGSSDSTLDELWQELRRPNRTPRDASPLPPMYSRRRCFEELKPGDEVPGLVKNLVDFGAFVDLGIKESGLVHVSEMADRFIKHPSEVVQVGQILTFRIKEIDTQRRRIALTLKGVTKT